MIALDPVASGDSASCETEGLHVVPDTGGVADAFLRQCSTLGRLMPTVGVTIPAAATRVLLLTALSPCGSAAEAGARVFETFRLLRSLALSHRDRRVEVIVAQNLGGDFGLISNPGARAELGAVAGLAKSAAREWPRATVRVLDFSARASSEELAAQLFQELAIIGGEGETGLKEGRRFTPQLVRSSTRVAPARTLQPGEVWIVSGGARGVTAACLQALVRRTPLRLALLGRTSIDEAEIPAAAGRTTDAELKRALLEDARAQGMKLTPAQLQRQVNGIVGAREARATCAALRAAGAEVRYFAVDISAPDAVAQVVQDVRERWGPIRGLVHGAGVLADKALHEKTDEQFRMVYGTKVDGFHALLAATRAEPLTAIGCFSSVAGRAGNAGQADYAAANEALNKLCQVEQHRRGASCLVRSINWGPWDGGMVSPGLKAHFVEKGVDLIPLEAGAEVFADLMTGVLSTTVECVVGAAALADYEEKSRRHKSGDLRP